MTAQLVLGPGNLEEWGQARFLSTLNIIYWYIFRHLNFKYELNDIQSVQWLRRAF
jgi:hypothetical protein